MSAVPFDSLAKLGHSITQITVIHRNLEIYSRTVHQRFRVASNEAGREDDKKNERNKQSCRGRARERVSVEIRVSDTFLINFIFSRLSVIYSMGKRKKHSQWKRDSHPKRLRQFSWMSNELKSWLSRPTKQTDVRVHVYTDTRKETQIYCTNTKEIRIQVWTTGTHRVKQDTFARAIVNFHETVCPLSLTALAGKGKMKELVIFRAPRFSSRGYFLRFTRIMQPTRLELARAYTPGVLPLYSLFRFCVWVRAGMRERERERERSRIQEPLMNACIFNARLKGCFCIPLHVPGMYQEFGGKMICWT